MAKNRVIYNIEGMFVGPAPATGYHFLNIYSGAFHNNPSNSGSVNLITPLQRVLGASYNFNVERSEIKALGSHSVISRPILNSPTVSLSFDYLQVGVTNEFRMGFYTNYSTNNSSTPYYSNNSGVYLLSGFITKTYDRAPDNNGWPLVYRDKRNIFLAINKDTDDLNSRSSRTRDIDVVGFGNCYLTSYSTSAEVGDSAKCSVNYICENMRYYSSGSDINIPAINYHDGTIVSGVKCSIPSLYEPGLTGAPAAILPGDISIDIKSYVNNTARYAANGNVINVSETGSPRTSDIKNLGLNFQDLRIERYSLSMELRREAQPSLRFKYPADRKLARPVYTNVDLDVLVSDNVTGSLENLVREDAEYNIAIKLRNPYNTNTYAVRYDLLGAKFQGISYQTSIGSNKTARLSFSTELAEGDLTRGMFMSGIVYQSPQEYGYLLTGEGSYLLLEDSGRIILEGSGNMVI